MAIVDGGTIDRLRELDAQEFEANQENLDTEEEEVSTEQLQRMGINTDDIPNDTPTHGTITGIDWATGTIAATEVTPLTYNHVMPMDGSQFIVADEAGQHNAVTYRNLFEYAPTLNVQGSASFSGFTNFDGGVDHYGPTLFTGRVDMTGDVYYRNTRLNDMFEEYNTKIVELEDKIRRLEEANGQDES